MKKIIGAIVLASGFAACAGDTSDLTPEQLGESEQGLLLGSFCVVQSASSNIETGQCWTGKGYAGNNSACSAGDTGMGAITADGALNGATVYVASKAPCNQK